MHASTSSFKLIAGREADVFAHRNRHAGHDDFAVAFAVEYLGKSAAASVGSVLPVPA